MTVSQLKDGRWVCEYPRGRNPEAPDRKRSYFGRGPEAEAQAWALNARLGLGTSRQQPSACPTFAALAEQYMSASLAREGSWERTYNRLAAVIVPLIGGMLANEVTETSLSRYILHRRSQVKDGTVRGELSVIRTVLRWGWKNKYLASNPMEGFRLPAANYACIQPPTTRELAAIIDHASPHLQRAILLAYHTGLRPGREELLSLTWAAVDWHSRTIHITSAHKGGRPVRIVPLSAALYAHLITWRAEDSAAVNHIVHFQGHRIDRLTTAWNAAKRRAGITRRLRLYDLRHKSITDMLDAGADLKSVSEIVGHSTPELTLKVYQHTTTKQHRSAVEFLGASLPPEKPDNHQILQ